MAIITFCASSTSASFIGPRASISSRIPSAARLDMQPRKRLRTPSSTPFMDLTSTSESTLRMRVDRFLSSSSSRLSKTNIASSIALATSRSILASLGMTRCSVTFRAPDRILAASRVPPSCSPTDLRVPPARRASIALSVSIASGGTGPSLATRRSWRPPSKSVPRKAFRQSLAVSGPIRRAPRASTLASLCWRDRRAIRLSVHRAARQPGIRLAAIEMPIPLPQTATPYLALPVATVSPSWRPKSG